MRSQKNKLKNSTGSGSSRAKQGSQSDVDSRLLQQVSSKIGNGGLNSQLLKTANDRDNLLEFLMSRLKNIQQIQQIELDEMALRPEWFRDVAKGEHGFFLPDPTRWKETAQTYKLAGEALCRGDVRRGKQLIEEAVQKEAAATESLPIQVTERLQSKQSDEYGSPVSTAAETSEICAARTPPKDLSIADEIIAVQATIRGATPVRRTRPYTWWEQQEDSEEESAEDVEQEQDTQVVEHEDNEKEVHIEGPTKQDPI